MFLQVIYLLAREKVICHEENLFEAKVIDHGEKIFLEKVICHENFFWVMGIYEENFFGEKLTFLVIFHEEMQIWNVIFFQGSENENPNVCKGGT